MIYRRNNFHYSAVKTPNKLESSLLTFGHIRLFAFKKIYSITQIE